MQTGRRPRRRRTEPGVRHHGGRTSKRTEGTPSTVATKAIVGEKVGMTQVWDENNRAVPVTVLKVAPLRVVQVKTPEREGYAALQVTWGVRRAPRSPSPSRATMPRPGSSRAETSWNCASTTPAASRSDNSSPPGS